MRQLRSCLIAVVLLAPLMSAPQASAATITGRVFGTAHDLNLVPGQPPPTTVFIVVFCDAQATGLPAFMEVSCNVVGGGPPGGGGTASSFPTVMNWPDSPYGMSYWYGSSPKPAYGCIEARAVYGDTSQVTYSECAKLSP